MAYRHRAESIARQLEGNEEKVDAGDLDISSMGEMNNDKRG